MCNVPGNGVKEEGEDVPTTWETVLLLNRALLQVGGSFPDTPVSCYTAWRGDSDPMESSSETNYLCFE